MNGRGALQIAPARHLADILRRIIDHHGQMIAGRHIFARQHYIAISRRIEWHDFCRAGAIFDIAQRGLDMRQCFFHIEPPTIRRAFPHQLFSPAVGQIAIQAGIKRCAIRVARPVFFVLNGGQNLAPRRPAWIDQALRAQCVQSRLVNLKARRLHHDRFGPTQPQPFKVLINAFDKMRPRASDINIFNTQKKLPARRARGTRADKRRIGMSQMQPTIRAWRKTGDKTVCRGLFIFHRGFSCAIMRCDAII